MTTTLCQRNLYIYSLPTRHALYNTTAPVFCFFSSSCCCYLLSSMRCPRKHTCSLPNLCLYHHGWRAIAWDGMYRLSLNAFARISLKTAACVLLAFMAVAGSLTIHILSLLYTGCSTFLPIFSYAVAQPRMRGASPPSSLLLYIYTLPPIYLPCLCRFFWFG